MTLFATMRESVHGPTRKSRDVCLPAVIRDIADIKRRPAYEYTPCPSCHSVAHLFACAVGQITTIVSRIPPR
jgi:hypothetical protein